MARKFLKMDLEQQRKQQKKQERQERLARKKRLIEEIKSKLDPRACEDDGEDRQSKEDRHSRKRGNPDNNLNWAMKILNVRPHSTLAEIKKNYLQLAQQYHPDKNGGKENIQEMQDLNEAWDRLKIQFR
jgi:DnaJ-domain-containing protein 1